MLPWFGCERTVTGAFGVSRCRHLSSGISLAPVAAMKHGAGDKEPWFYSKPVRWTVIVLAVSYVVVFPYFLYRSNSGGNFQSGAGSDPHRYAGRAFPRPMVGKRLSVTPRQAAPVVPVKAAAPANAAPEPAAPAQAAPKPAAPKSADSKAATPAKVPPKPSPPAQGAASQANAAPGTYSGTFGKSDGGPFADLFLKHAEKHRKLQQDMLEGKVPLTRAIIAHCGPSQICAGHGDRAFGVLVLYLAAIFTDRAFFIDMSKPKPMEDYMEANKLEWRIGAIKNSTVQGNVRRCANGGSSPYQDCQFRDILLPGGQCVHIMGLVFSERNFVVVNSDHRTECVEKILVKQGVVPPKGQHGYSGTAEDLRWWAANVSHVMSHWLYRFKDNIVEKAVKTLTPSGAKAPIMPECLVCIHVRSGVGVGERGRHTNWNDFASCAQTANAYLEKSKACPTKPSWLVIGDNNKAASEIFKHVALSPKPSLITTNSLGPPTHLDQNNQASSDMVAHVFIDWYILGHCRTMVASLSTFGATASLIAGPSVERFDMEVANHANGCGHHHISDWQRDANIPG